MEHDVKIMVCGSIALSMYVLTMLFIIADLISGVRKAKKAGVLRTSEGYKRTINKVAKYSNSLFAMSVMDAVQLSLVFALDKYYGMTIPMLPLFTVVGTAFIGFVEIKSILEPSDLKERRQMKEVTMLAQEILRHRSEPIEIAKAVAEYLNGNENNKKEEDKGYEKD